MPLSLDDVLNAPTDPALLNRHLQTLGLVPAPMAPTAAAPDTPASIAPMAPRTMPTMTPPVKLHETVHVTDRDPGPEMASHAEIGSLAPPVPRVPLQPLNVAGLDARTPETASTTAVPGGIQPMTPPVLPTGNSDLLNAPRKTLEAFHSREQDAPDIDRIAPVGQGPQILQPGTAAYDRNKIDRMEDEKANPYGTPQNHPGVIGKILHGLAKAGNIAGDIVAPGTMALIPGTDLNKRVEEGKTTARMEKERIGETEAAQEKNAEAREKSEEPLREAQIKNIESEIAERGIKQQQLEKDEDGNVVGWKDAKGALHSLKEEGTPQAIKDIAEATKSKHAKTAFEAWQKQNPDAPVDEFLKMSAEAREKDTEQEKAISDYLQGHNMQDTPANRDKARDVLKTRDKTPRSPTEREEWLKDHPGKNIEDFWKAKGETAGRIKMEFPTTQMRNVGAQAAMAADQIPRVVARIDTLKDKLGPISGRWNEFIQGKVGLDDPEFASLRADLLMVSSAVALAHARGRLPENLREEFDHMINAPKQDPENLKAILTAIQPWMQRMTELGESGEGKAPTAAGAAPAANALPSFKDWQAKQKKP